jgi:hypothetical protein
MGGRIPIHFYLFGIIDFRVHPYRTPTIYTYYILIQIQIKENIKMEIINLFRHSEYDEPWLKDKIAEKPELLGLGRLRLLEREKYDRIAGITDLIMESSDRKNLFVIEVMVGEIDESHIVRSILYWLTEKNAENMKNIYPICLSCIKYHLYICLHWYMVYLT